MTPPARDITWMLRNFTTTTSGVTQLVAVSADGLLMGIGATWDQGTAEKLAATVSGLVTLSSSASHLVGTGSVIQSVIECETGYLVTFMVPTQTQSRACLGVLASRDCDLGVVAYETAQLVGRFGAALTPEVIEELKQANT